MTMRFEPPADATGRSVETVLRTRITWLLGEQSPLAPARLTVALTFHRGQASGCALRPEGAVPVLWTRLACRTLTQTVDYYFGARRSTARRGRVVIELKPAGAEALPPPAEAGTAVAARHTQFEVDGEGDFHNCRTTLNEGFGTPREDHEGPCGFFVVKSWFDRSADPQRVVPAEIQVSVYVDDPGPRRGRGS
jgi:hypothetical protein